MADPVYRWMLRFAAGLFAMLLFLSACATVRSGPRLSQANVRQIADAEVRHKIDLRQYEISALHYIPKGDYWLVIYHRKANKRVSLTVRVSDKMEKASISGSDAEIFEGGLTEKPDYH
jgi:hypothetical protein